MVYSLIWLDNYDHKSEHTWMLMLFEWQKTATAQVVKKSDATATSNRRQSLQSPFLIFMKSVKNTPTRSVLSTEDSECE